MDITNGETGEVHTIDEENLSSDKAIFFAKLKEKMEAKIQCQLALQELDHVITMYANIMLKEEEEEVQEDAE